MRLTPFDPAPSSRDDDENALQTDVMRFMAIIAFCLLVVFIPLAKSLPDTVEPSPEIIQQDIDREILEGEVDRLQALNALLMRRLARLQEHMTDLIGERVQLAEVEDRLDAAEGELATLHTEVRAERTRSHLLQERLNRVLRQLRRQEERIIEAEERVLPTPRPAPTVAATPTAVAPPLSPPAVVVTEPTPRPRPTAAAPPGRQVIRFASHDDLLELVRGGSIEFVVHTFGKLFRLLPQRTGFTFRLIDRFDTSERTYYMPEGNVPLEVLVAFRRHHANLVSPSWRFYLKVSPELEDELTRRTAGGLAGDYVIHRDGSVRHVP
jgi:hypothetical protein